MGIEIGYTVPQPFKKFRCFTSSDWSVLMQVFAGDRNASSVTLSDKNVPELKAMSELHAIYGRATGYGTPDGGVYDEILHAIAAHGAIRVEARW